MFFEYDCLKLESFIGDGSSFNPAFFSLKLNYLPLVPNGGLDKLCNDGYMFIYASFLLPST